MAQVQVLFLLAAALAIQCSQCEVSEVFVEIGSLAVLPCVIQSPNDLGSAVSWKKINAGEERTVWRRDKSGLEFRPAGRAPHAFCPHPNFGKGKYSLHIENVREEDAGQYRCKVDGVSIFKDVMLRVVKVSLSSFEVIEGERLELTCSVTPSLYNILTTWKQNGTTVKTYSQKYVIDKVSQRHKGTWSCQVQYRGAEVTASAFLQVKGILAPQDTSTVVYAAVGSSVILPCIFSNRLILSSVSWKKASGATHLTFQNSSNSECFVTQCDRSALIESVQEADEGTYRCAGQIEGDSGKTVTVERNIRLVTAQIQPSSRKGSLSLTCHVSDSSKVTKYEWYHLSYGENNTQVLTPFPTSSSKVPSILKVEKQHLGEWVCLYYAQQQLLGNVTYLNMMSGLAGQKETTSGTKVAGFIGLAFLALVVLLVFLQMYKNHRRRKMIMQYPAMETIVHLAANEREFRERGEKRNKGGDAACGDDPKTVCV